MIKRRTFYLTLLVLLFTGMTRSAIAAGTIVTGDGTDISTVNRDTAGANNGALSMELPDLQQILSQQADRAAVAQQASAAVARTVGDMADHLAREAVKSNDFNAFESWSEGGVNRAIAHGVSQAIVAGLGGGDALGGGLGAAEGSYLTPSFAGVTGSEAMDKLLGNIAAGVIGNAVGGGSGSFTGGSVELNNRQLHPTEYDFIRSIAKGFAEEHGITVEEAVRLLIRGALYLNDEQWARQYDRFFGEETELYQRAGSYVRNAAAEQGFQIVIDGVNQAGFTSSTSQYRNTILGVRELSQARLTDDMLAYATVRGSGSFSWAEYQLALKAGEAAGLPSGGVVGAWGLVEGITTGLWDLSGLAPGGVKSLYETARYGSEEAARLQFARWESIRNAASSPIETAHGAMGAGWDAALAYDDLLSLYEAQGAGWDYGFAQGKVAGQVGFDVASFFIGVGEIKAAANAMRAAKAAEEVKIAARLADDAGKALLKSERLSVVYERLSRAPTATTAEEAMRQMHETLDAVEDVFSGVPKAANPGLKPDGRMYPAQADKIVTGVDGSISATSLKQITTYGAKGSITVTDRATGVVLYHKNGGV